MKWALVIGFLFVVVATVASQSDYKAQSRYKKEDESSAGKITIENDIEFDSFEDASKSDDDDGSKSDESLASTPPAAQPGIVSRIFSAVVSVPRTIFTAVGNFFSSAPLTRLRDEMKNLNITYPKK